MSVRVVRLSGMATLLLGAFAPLPAHAEGEGATAPPEPPLLNPAAPGWDETPDTNGESGEGTPAAEPAGPPGPPIESAVGAQWLWAVGKAMPGVLVRGGHRMLWFDVETTFVVLTDSSDAADSHFLGTQLGFHALFRPLYGERGELNVGAGADVYALWNIHGDEWQAALTFRAEGHVYLSKCIGVFGNARVYPLASSGLELGVARDHSRGLPVLFGTGAEWRFP
jgi:hypothetical protein